MNGKRIRETVVAGAFVACMGMPAYAGLNDVYWTPAEISTVAWFDAADTNTLTLAGSVVNQWNDKSTNSNHAVKTSAPTYISSDPMMNSMPSIYHNESGQYGFTTPSMSAKSIYAVIYYGDGTDTSFTGGVAGWRSLLSNAGGPPHLMGANGTSSWYVELMDEFYRNGTNASSSLNAIPMPATLWKFKKSSTATQTFGIGYGSSGRGWNGGYSEFVFTDGTEDLTTEQKIEGYLAWKWELEGRLPQDHPYKTKAPGAPPNGTVITLY